MKKQTLKIGSILMAIFALTAMGYAGNDEPTADVDVSVSTDEGVPGGVMVSTVTIQAKVVAIDYEAREIELLLPGGAVEDIEVGPDAINFNQINVGDMVVAQVTQELVISMGASDSELADGDAAVVVAAAPGEEPGAVAVETVRMTATVVEIDGELRTARLSFPDGTEQVVEVRDDIDLTLYSVGDKVVFEITEMVALSVEKQ